MRPREYMTEEGRKNKRKYVTAAEEKVIKRKENESGRKGKIKNEKITVKEKKRIPEENRVCERERERKR